MFKIVDLFSGVGGLTFGFEYTKNDCVFYKRNTFESILALDSNYDAISAFKLNFPDIPTLNKDIKEVSLSDFDDLHVDINNVDAVIGGPPCQSFSTIGKRRNDDRAKLYEEYVRLLTILRPKIFLFENVKGLLSMKNDNNKHIIDLISDEFDNIGYNITWKVLNSASFGIPQLRERVFIVGTKKEFNLKFEFPRECVSPSNFLTLSDAISDLPELNNGDQSTIYYENPKSEFEKLMRANSSVLLNHENGYKSELIMEIIEALEEGDSKIDINKRVEQGLLPTKLFRKSGYNNSYGRLLWNKPGMTITNRINCPSSLRCIHPKQNRALTPREGARIQSFPDWFQFYGSKSSVMSQIGNAVPPLLSIHFADAIEKYLRKVNDND